MKRIVSLLVSLLLVISSFGQKYHIGDTLIVVKGIYGGDTVVVKNVNEASHSYFYGLKGIGSKQLYKIFLDEDCLTDNLKFNIKQKYCSTVKYNINDTVLYRNEYYIVSGKTQGYYELARTNDGKKIYENDNTIEENNKIANNTNNYYPAPVKYPSNNNNNNNYDKKIKAICDRLKTSGDYFERSGQSFIGSIAVGIIGGGIGGALLGIGIADMDDGVTVAGGVICGVSVIGSIVLEINGLNLYLKGARELKR